MTLDFMRFAGVPGEKPKYGKGDNKREKRLERNRESARKCRRKRKAYVGDLEDKFQGMAEDNAMLQLENDRLRELLQQLQNGEGILPESLPKRHKSEFGVSMANDFSESAAGGIFSAGHLDHLSARRGTDDDLDDGDLSDDTAPAGGSRSCTSGETDGRSVRAREQGAVAATEKLQCDLEELLPLTEGLGTATNEEITLLPAPVKLEDLDIIEMPPSDKAQGEISAIDTNETFPGLETLTSDETCSDLVSTFANDAVSGPVSLDDFLEI